MWSRLILMLMITMLPVSCAQRRIDVDRKGDIKMRGEKQVKMRGKKPGDLLQKGVASWYGHPYHGRKTSNGETYNMHRYTAAHKSLPFGTVVKVVDRDTKKSVFVRINDRGPFVRGRHIDLSYAAAQTLGTDGKGIANVAIYLAKQKDWDRQGNVPQIARKPKPKPVLTQPKPKPAKEAPVEHIVYAPEETIEEEILEPETTHQTPISQPIQAWAVQVGSFSTSDRANDHARAMQVYGAPVHVVTQGGYYKVRVGTFTTKEAAAPLVAQLKRDGHPTWVLKN